jgi:hypothetical protein
VLIGIEYGDIDSHIPYKRRGVVDRKICPREPFRAVEDLPFEVYAVVAARELVGQQHIVINLHITDVDTAEKFALSACRLRIPR